MSALVIAGDTSGTITIEAPAVAGTNTLTLPASTGTLATTASPTFTGQATIPTINLTGGQITFPVTQSASADANTLDDYEEGTFTPSLTSTSGGVSATFTSNGKYTKIGRQVHIHADVVLTALAAAGSGALILGNLPFSSNGLFFGSCIFSSVDLPASTIQITIYSSGTTCLFINNFDNSVLTDGQTSYLTATSGFYYDITYFV
jgi:hypothetical protein